MIYKNESIRFGILAVEKGYITERELGRAVSQQMKEDLAQTHQRFLGEILLEMGFINNSEIQDVLHSLKH